MRGPYRAFCGVLASTLHSRRNLLFAGLLSFGLIVCLNVAGCQKKEETKPVTPAAKSAVAVRVSSESITASTPSAEFRLSPSGALTASLAGTNVANSLDEKSLDASQIVAISRKEHPGVALDLSQAQVGGTSGKLGALGKRIEVTGKRSRHAAGGNA